MLNIKGAVVTWHAIGGSPPYLEEYELAVRVRTIIGPGPSYREEHRIGVRLPPSYPVSPPLIVMKSSPQPFHPNWFADGRWCCGPWTLEGLGQHVVRMIRTLQFDPEITNPDSPANREANTWYLEHRERGIFPCDRKGLPDPTQSRFVMQKETLKKTFRME
ncbi:MAG: hypothetical protein FJY73_03935 [Candidatus Eisenbacteria bacterium]|nr:hypothetical protein [Candidatus Eisenbacteria bacterium]